MAVGFKAARRGDAHAHGGALITGSPNVLVSNMPQARAGIDFLSPAERRAIARLRNGRNGAPLAVADLVSIYNKLGLRNRRELDRLARLGAQSDD